jgi:hypothetical protein
MLSQPTETSRQKPERNEQERAAQARQHGGSRPDIAKVISVTDTQSSCGVVPATMVYEDSQGVRHHMDYRVMGDGCHDN